MRTGAIFGLVVLLSALAWTWHRFPEVRASHHHLTTEAQNGPLEPAGALIAHLEKKIPARMASDGVAGVVVVVLQQGAPVWTAAFGSADSRTGRPMTADALFRVESISKPVTAWGAMRLAETGRLDLDAPI